MEVSRISIADLKLVYAICANKKISYPHGQSPVAYIGTTEKGIARIARSAAYWAEDVLGMHGVHTFHVRIITCPTKRGVKTWRKLERALLLQFREKYGGIPCCNTVGKGFRETNEFGLFSRARVRKILENLELSGVAPDHLVGTRN